MGSLVPEGKSAWLVGATYKTGLVTLRLIRSPDLESIEWVDRNFQPYYLITRKQGEPVKKIDLFTGNELTLSKVNYTGKTPKDRKAWELDIDPALATPTIRGSDSVSFTVSAKTVGFRMPR